MLTTTEVEAGPVRLVFEARQVSLKHKENTKCFNDFFKSVSLDPSSPRPVIGPP